MGDNMDSFDNENQQLLHEDSDDSSIYNYLKSNPSLVITIITLLSTFVVAFSYEKNVFLSLDKYIQQ